MAVKKHDDDVDNSEIVVAKAKDFWERYGKTVTIILAAVVIGVGGYFIYQKFFKDPKEAKATDALYKAEQYFRNDSVNLALNGDGVNPGLLRVIDKYSGTDAANLANFYAGSCYIKLGENDKAIKYLKK